MRLGVLGIDLGVGDPGVVPVVIYISKLPAIFEPDPVRLEFVGPFTSAGAWSVPPQFRRYT